MVVSYGVTNTALPSLASLVIFIGFALLLFSHIINLADTVLGSLTEIVRLRWRRGIRRLSLGAAICLFAIAVSAFFVHSVSKNSSKVFVRIINRSFSSYV